MFFIANVPIEERGRLRIRQAGYDNYLVLATGSVALNVGGWCVASRSAIEGWYEDVAETSSAAKATLGVEVLKETSDDLWVPAVGATVAIEPLTGSGPYYAAAGDYTTLDPEGLAITDAGLAAFLNLDVTAVTASVALDGHVCDTALLGDAGLGAVTLTADAATWLAVKCTEL